LRRQESPPSRENISSLESLSEQYERVALFREALGWKLLRAGQYEHAAQVFNQLGERTDLNNEEKSSVMLALGMLAAVDSRHAKTGAKLRAAVSAAPANLKASESPLPPTITIEQSPVEFRDLDSPPPSMRGAFSSEEEASSPRMMRVGPVFAGDLQLFA
jgi:hypothetical protein